LNHVVADDFKDHLSSLITCHLWS